jgi:iron-sulfur cluster insertion protein
MSTEQSKLPPQALAFTEHAAEKVKELGARQDFSGSMLRVYIQGGGCSGFQYGFALSRPTASSCWWIP